MAEAPSTSNCSDGKKSAEERREILDQAFAGTCLEGGRRVARPVAGQSQFDSVLVRGRTSHHRMHLFLTIITVGLWGPIWLATWLTQREKREIGSVDEYGNTAVTPA